MYVQFIFFHETKIPERNAWVVRVSAYTDLRKQFLEIARKNSPEPRTIYSFMTTAIVRALPILIFSIYQSIALWFRTRERCPQLLR
jgi:hypothetical protein